MRFFLVPRQTRELCSNWRSNGKQKNLCISGEKTNKKPTLSSGFPYLFRVVHFKTLHKFCSVISCNVIRFVHQLAVKRNGCFDAFDIKLV